MLKPNVELMAASEDEKPIMERMFQLYLYDFSEFDGDDVDNDGLFQASGDLGRYWKEPGRIPFFIVVSGEMAGFVLIRGMTGSNDGWTGHSVAEFFVMKKYRLGGVGTRAAIEIFDRFPGRWQVTQIESNVGAQHFWRKVINRYTGSRFTEEHQQTTWLRGYVQRFDNFWAAHRSTD